MRTRLASERKEPALRLLGGDLDLGAVQGDHVAAARRLGPLEAALGDCDFVASEARARPVAVILNLNPYNRFTPAQFVAWFRCSGSPS